MERITTRLVEKKIKVASAHQDAKENIGWAFTIEYFQLVITGKNKFMARYINEEKCDEENIFHYGATVQIWRERSDRRTSEKAKHCVERHTFTNDQFLVKKF